MAMLSKWVLCIYPGFLLVVSSVTCVSCCIVRTVRTYLLCVLHYAVYQLAHALIGCTTSLNKYNKIVRKV